MQVERNPYDPIEVKWPTWWYWFRAGAAVTLGAACVTGVAWLVAMISFFGLLGSLGSLMHR